MLQIFSQMFPILFLIGLGLVAVRSGFTSQTQIEGLGGFVINFALPAVILSALTHQDLSQSLNPGYLAAYAGGSLVAFTAVFLFIRFVLGRPLERAGIGALGAAGSNTGFIGFPIAALVLGAPATIAMPMTMMVENMLIIPIGLALAEMGTSNGASVRRMLGETAMRLSRMPFVIAIIVGAALSLFGVRFPVPLASAIDMLGQASAPVALFVVGGTIAGLRRGDVGLEIPPIVIGKLVLHPLVVAAAFYLIPGVPAELAATGILFSSVSMLTIYPDLRPARRNGEHGRRGADHRDPALPRHERRRSRRAAPERRRRGRNMIRHDGRRRARPDLTTRFRHWRPDWPKHRSC